MVDLEYPADEILGLIEAMKGRVFAAGCELIHSTLSAHNARKGTLEGRTAYAALEAAYADLHADSEAGRDFYPSHLWLTYLRHVPLEGFGSFQRMESGDERRRYIEAFSAHSTCESEERGPRDFPSARIARLVLRGRLLYHLQYCMDAAAKDVPIDFDLNELPAIHEDDPRTKALRLYDQRRATTSYLNAVSGTVPVSENHSPPGAAASLLHVWPKELVEPGPGVEAQPADGEAYVMSYIPLRLPPMAEGVRWYQDTLPGALLVNHAVSLYLFGASIQNRSDEQIYPADATPAVFARRFGFIRVPRSEFCSLLDALLNGKMALDLSSQFFESGIADATVDSLLHASEQVPALAFPFSGPGIRPIGADMLLIDLRGDTFRCTQLLYPYQLSEDDVHHRSTDFELTVQAAIDRTAWRPVDEKIRCLRGVDLIKLDGHLLTDLDAIAVRDGVGLFIDAKAIADQGVGVSPHARVRSIRERLETKWSKWVSQISYLERNPKGRNYDFSALHTFVPLLATSAPQFVHEELTRPMFERRLRPVVGYAELVDFLSALDPPVLRAQ